MARAGSKGETATTASEVPGGTHRDPGEVEGLSPEKRADHEAAPSADRRSRSGRKPYTTESEAYGGEASKPPTDPAQRAEARRPPTR